MDTSTTYDAHTFDAAAGTSVDDHEKINAVHVWDTPLPFAAGALLGRQSDQDIVVFKSNGIAAWDLAAAALVLKRARTEQRGLELHL